MPGCAAGVAGLGAAVGVEGRAVVDAAVDLDAVVLDGAPLAVEELVVQVLAGGQTQLAGNREAAGVHLVGGQVDGGQVGVDQSGVGHLVVLADPFADDLFELCDVVEGALLDVEAA